MSLTDAGGIKAMRNANSHYGQATCAYKPCSKKFNKSRSWQIYCSNKCRFYAWQDNHANKDELIKIKKELKEIQKKLGIK